MGPYKKFIRALVRALSWAAGWLSVACTAYGASCISLRLKPSI